MKLDKFLIEVPCKTKIKLINNMGNTYYYGLIKHIPDKLKNLYFYKVVDYKNTGDVICIEIKAS